MLQLFQKWLTIAKFTLIVLGDTQHLAFSHILGLKIGEKSFIVIQITVTEIV